MLSKLSQLKETPYYQTKLSKLSPLKETPYYQSKEIPSQENTYLLPDPSYPPLKETRIRPIYPRLTCQTELFRLKETPYCQTKLFSLKETPYYQTKDIPSQENTYLLSDQSYPTLKETRIRPICPHLTCQTELFRLKETPDQAILTQGNTLLPDQAIQVIPTQGNTLLPDQRYSQSRKHVPNQSRPKLSHTQGNTYQTNISSSHLPDRAIPAQRNTRPSQPSSKKLWNLVPWDCT